MTHKNGNQPLKLDRALSRPAATLMTAAMIVGNGLFASLGGAAAQAGSGILMAMLIGGVIVLATGLSGAQSGITFPEEGGAFVWTRKLGYPRLSFLAGCAYIAEGTVGLGIIALAFASYSAQIFQGLPIPLAASVAVLLVALINFFGVSPTAKTMIGIFFINVTLLTIFAAFAIPHFQLQHLKPVFGESWGGLLRGAAIFFWTWDGFQRTAIMVEEVQKPRQTIPFVILRGISLAALVYLIVATTTLGGLGPVAIGQSHTPVVLSVT